MIRNRDVYGEDGLTHRAAAVFMYLSDRADKDGACFPAVRTIARELKLSPRTVQRAVADLVQAGFVRRVFRERENNRGQSSNLYVLRQGARPP